MLAPQCAISYQPVSKPESWLNCQHIFHSVNDQNYCFASPNCFLRFSSPKLHKMELATSTVSGTQVNFLCPNILKTLSFHSHKFPQRTNFLNLHSLVPRPFSNAFICRGSSFGFINNITSNSNYTNNTNNKIYKRLDSCLIIPPFGNKKPRAIIQFLGGAFIGAVPEVSYSYLIELLAKEGFLIISVPYDVTFDHEQAAKQVYERFNACLDNILAFGFPDANLAPADLVNLPLFSVGHSNGALLQVLTGSYFSEKIPKANAIISYNNRPATEAVPYFEQLGPLVRQMMPMVEASPVYSMARSASDDAWKFFIDTAGAMIPDRDQEALVSFTKFVDQLPSVFGQVTQGISEFKPTPYENRECCKNKYNVQNTLLVKFTSDTIDETDLLEETLKSRVDSIGGTLEKVQLSGNHITPCLQEPKWQVGVVYTPADAIAQGLKTLALNETKVLSRTIVDWFRRFED